MKHISLFAGIGGMDLGFDRAGFTCVAQVEIDEYCRKVLQKHWPEVPKYGDITTVRGCDLPDCDVLAGGFPCQGISENGFRQGLADERSGLWFEYLRLIREIRPRYVVIENVAALLRRGGARVLSDLAASGYDAQWDCLPASAFGAPHQRDRAFIVAYHRQERIKRLFIKKVSRVEEFQGFQNVRGVEDLRERPDLPDALFCGGRDGVPSWVDRVGACGNAVVPAIAQYVAECILCHANQNE